MLPQASYKAWVERGTQDSNLESPVLETGALANYASAPIDLILGNSPDGK